MIERIYLWQIKELLNYVSNKAVERWCEKFHVTIYQDEGCKPKYAIRKIFISAYNTYTNGDLKREAERIKATLNIQTELYEAISHKKYTSQGKIEKSMLSQLTKAIEKNI